MQTAETHPHRLENLMGALSVVISDRVNEKAETLIGMGGEAPAAVVQIGTLPGLTITSLGSALGLTHSATVRVVAKLEAEKLVKKARGEDAREVRVTLTTAGERSMKKILSARESVLSKLLSTLPMEARTQLDGLLTSLLRTVAGDEEEANRICRMCDENCCRGGPGCPVTSYA
jgi:DNA-binding MarR family transcriptional regulator